MAAEMEAAMVDISALLEETTARQRAAADPNVAAWVSANAGTGKTHVLVNRVARLLLAGADPARILCITYTKAAAAEMATRLFKRLGEWSLAPDKELLEQLNKLHGNAVHIEELKQARRLFARALESPGGLKIQTIHGFCQSVLKRFPLEAGIHPGFDLLENEAALELQTRARHDLFETVLRGEDRELSASHHLLVETRDETQLTALLATFMGKSDEFEALFEQFQGEQLWEETWRHLGLAPGTTPRNIVEAETTDDALDAAGLRDAIGHLSNGAKTSKKFAEILTRFMETDARADLYDEYKSIFLTQKGERRAKLITKGAEGALDVLEAELVRILAVQARIAAATTAANTRAALTFGGAYLQIYKSLKKIRGALDFNDLIIQMRELLTPPNDAWVHYKLDEGIDHILVDEAQDTSPQQWEIIQRLAAEMTAGLGAAEASDRSRSLFAVGDVKQSIYRFQGAQPEKFAAMRNHFGRRWQEATREFRSVELDLSFRSSRPILDAVDAVFKTVQLSTGDGIPEDLQHRARHADAPGVVELWPIVEPEEETEDQNPWDVPLNTKTASSPEGRLAQDIAARIRGWLNIGEMLAGADRPIIASDIMILVRRRSSFMEHMIRCLKQQGIPVAGADRLKIKDHIAVQDLMSLGSFALTPNDDLALAEVLKSPFIGLNDEQLFAIAYDRVGTLWQALTQAVAQAAAKDNTIYASAYDWLTRVRNRADFMPPYEFFASVLYQDGGKAKLLARLGPDAEDPIEEFMAQALFHEHNETPSLHGFLHALARSTSDIKRDMEQGRNEVRVMTVHGAKGLEGNIVFLPDTCAVPKSQSDNGILESQPVGRDGEPEASPLFLWSPRKADDDPITALAREVHVSETQHEYRRLLYVAMTRARERLYICGWTGVNGSDEGCWHDLVSAGLAEMAEHAETGSDTPILRLAHDGPARNDEGGGGFVSAQVGPVPDWARTSAPKESSPQRLSPSKLEDESAVFPPGGSSGQAALRGTLVHRLLQTLPDLPEEKREQAAAKYLANFATGFSTAEQKELADETLKLMALPEMVELIGAAGRAEVPIAGTVEIKGEQVRLEGRADRLAIVGETVWILDYKTNRPAPADVDKVSKSYLRQMAGYRELLRQIYPRFDVQSALVWTHGPHVMVLRQEDLDAQWSEIAGKSSTAK